MSQPNEAQLRLLHSLEAEGWEFDLPYMDAAGNLVVDGYDRDGEDVRGLIRPCGDLLHI